MKVYTVTACDEYNGWLLGLTHTIKSAKQMAQDHKSTVDPSDIDWHTYTPDEGSYYVKGDAKEYDYYIIQRRKVKP